ncbi:MULTISPECIES: hypothetical protein [unclassified Nocardia]|uniref:hypothetical protein n=1 Tax=unclassified Nocardia TaxID=2637762 RepID=UPI0035D957E4
MTMRAIGYLDRTVSLLRTEHDECEIRIAAQLLGRELIALIYAHEDAYPSERLLEYVTFEAAQSIIVPSLAHLSEDDIAELYSSTDVYCLAESRLYTIYCADEAEPEGTLRIAPMWTPNEFGKARR